jgi:DNA gyrase subunit A
LTDLNFKQILPVAIEDEMKRSYLDYAMSVIVSRALPDVRDGLKPVHRRILYAMMESNCDWNKPYRKSARIVGEVMGKYHPHGDAAIYDSLVRMAQNFSLRLPLIDGQGNFGSMDGDSPAAMRYTESRLAKISHSMIDDINLDTVDYQENYDGAEKEPEVLPAKFPNLLVNGANGIAVGMATNIPPHNLGEIIDACIAYIEDHEISEEDIGQYIKGPDFPTGGLILGRTGIRSAIKTGRGSIIIRGKAHIEDIKEKRQAIIITEIPYQVNKAKMVERIAELVKEKRIEGISDLRDESDKAGVRVVVEIKRDTVPEVVLNQLYAYSPLQTSFGVNMLALDYGQPRLMNMKEIIMSFINFREVVITRRTRYLINKARSRTHILIGLLIAVNNIDEIIDMIKTSKDPNEARERLLSRSWPAEEMAELIKLVGDNQNEIEGGGCFFTETQTKAILDMRLQRLTGLEFDKIREELGELKVEILGYLEILSSRLKLLEVLKGELITVKEEFGTPRRTQIEEVEFEKDIEDLIQREDMVVTVTYGGYVKRVPLVTYRAQKRGGKGRSGVGMNEEDITTHLFISSTHNPVLFFSNIGKVYKLKVYKLPLGSPTAKGRAFINIFPLAANEKITNVMVLPEDEKSWSSLNIVFATSMGNIRRNELEDFKNIQSNGKIAIRLEDGDSLIGVNVCDDDNHILLAARSGKSLRFPVSALRVFKSRTSDGVRGMRLDNDEVVSMSILRGAEVDIETREAFLRIPIEVRRQITLRNEGDSIQDLIKELEINLDQELIMKMAKEEDLILTITENGYGKRSSAYEYRVTNRGGQGITNIITSERNGLVSNSFAVQDNDQIMLITDKGTLIRSPVKDIRVIGRNTQGVLLFRTTDGEKVVAAARIAETDNDEDLDHEENEE